MVKREVEVRDARPRDWVWGFVEGGEIECGWCAEPLLRGDAFRFTSCGTWAVCSLGCGAMLEEDHRMEVSP